MVKILRTKLSGKSYILPLNFIQRDFAHS